MTDKNLNEIEEAKEKNRDGINENKKAKRASLKNIYNLLMYIVIIILLSVIIIPIYNADSYLGGATDILKGTYKGLYDLTGKYGGTVSEFIYSYFTSLNLQSIETLVTFVLLFIIASLMLFLLSIIKKHLGLKSATALFLSGIIVLNSGAIQSLSQANKGNFSQSAIEAGTPMLSLTDVMLAGSYFYENSYIDGVNLEYFDEYIMTLINDSLDYSDKIYENAKKVDQELTVLYELVKKVMSTGYTFKGDIKNMIAFEEIYNLAYLNKLAINELESSDNDEPFIRSAKTTKLVSHTAKYTNYLSTAYAQMITVCAGLLETNDEHSKYAKKIIDILDNGHSLELIDENRIYTKLINENHNYMALAKMENAINTIDYALSKAGETNDNLKELELLDNELIPVGFAEALREYANSSALMMIGAKIAIERSLVNVTYDDDIIVSHIFENDNKFVLTVFADDNSIIGQIPNAKETLKKNKATVEKGWFSSFVDTVKTVADYTGINAARHVVGTALEVVDGTVGVMANVAVGLYDGESAEEINKRIDERLAQSFKEIESGTAGNDVLSNTTSMLDSTANLVGEGYGTIADNIMIMGNDLIGMASGTYDGTELPTETVGAFVSWIGSTAGSTFTSLGSGASKILNTSSDASDIAKGIFEVVTAMAGGSQNIGKAAPEGSRKTLTFLKDSYDDIAKAFSEEAGESAIKSFDDLAKVGKERFSQFADDFIKNVKKSYDDNVLSDDVFEGIKNVFSGEIDEATFLVGELVDHMVYTDIDNRIGGLIEKIFNKTNDKELTNDELEKINNVVAETGVMKDEEIDDLIAEFDGLGFEDNDETDSNYDPIKDSDEDNTPLESDDIKAYKEEFEPFVNMLNQKINVSIETIKKYEDLAYLTERTDIISEGRVYSYKGDSSNNFTTLIITVFSNYEIFDHKYNKLIKYEYYDGKVSNNDINLLVDGNDNVVSFYSDSGNVIFRVESWEGHITNEFVIDTSEGGISYERKYYETDPHQDKTYKEMLFLNIDQPLIEVVYDTDGRVTSVIK